MDSWQRLRGIILPAALVLVYLNWKYMRRLEQEDRTPEAVLHPDDLLAKVMTRDGTLLTSYYASWIEKDLSRWKESLISQSMVERAAADFQCESGKLRVQIVNGTLWVDHSLEPWPPGGWYPAELGGGWTSAKARTPYLILALLETLRQYPGQVPDVDVVMHTSDKPCVASWPGGPAGAPAPPIFGYTTTDGFQDIPFPDFSFWGHEHNRMRGGLGSLVHGWERQFRLLADNVSAALPLHRRVPQLVWRGRVSSHSRDELRRQFVECPEIFKALKHADQELFNLWEPEVKLDEACNWRYLAYVESGAWATNLKQKLACGSVVLAIRPRFFEFFSRALRAGVHYVEVQPAAGPGAAFSAMCTDLDRQVKYMEREFQRAGLPVNPHVDLKDTFDDPWEPTPWEPMAHVHLESDVAPDTELVGEDGWGLLSATAGPGISGPAAEVAAGFQPPSAAAAWLFSVAEMQGSDDSPSSDTATGSAEGLNQGLGRVPLKPWDVAANGQEFLRRHVRMQDVREYVRDVLVMYGSLQDFQPTPVTGAECYRGAQLLEQFGFPFHVDRSIMQRAYPWLEAFVQPGCPIAPEGLVFDGAPVVAESATEVTAVVQDRSDE